MNQGNAEKFKVEKIEIEQLEGRTGELLKASFPSYEEANEALKTRAGEYPYPDSGGCFKHDFVVTWTNRENYFGRLDCKHPDCEDNDLDVGEHIKEFCLCHLRGPKYLDEETKQAFLGRIDEETKRAFRVLLDHYELEEGGS